MSCRYLWAHFAKSQLWHASCLLFAFFLTEACGLAPATMGWVLGVSLVLNGLADLVIGAALNGRITDGLRATRLQARAAPAIATCFLLFALTPPLPPERRVVWAVATLSGFRLLYPLLDVAQNALVPMMTANATGQRRLLGARNIVSSVASLGVASIAAPLLIARHGVATYILWAGVIAGFMGLTAWWLASKPPLCDRSPVAVEERRAPPRDFAVVLTALAAMMAAATLFRTMEPYFAAFASRGMAMLVWSSLGAIVSQPLWLFLIRRHGSISALCRMAATLLLAALLLMGPARGTGGGGGAIGLVYGAGSSGLWLILWSMMTCRAVPGRTLRYVGAFTCVSKLSQGAAMLLVGRVLSTTRYSVTLGDPASPPSMAMAVALIVMAAVALALAGYERAVSRTARAGTAATPRPAER